MLKHANNFGDESSAGSLTVGRDVGSQLVTHALQARNPLVPRAEWCRQSNDVVFVEVGVLDHDHRLVAVKFAVIPACSQHKKGVNKLCRHACTTKYRHADVGEYEAYGMPVHCAGQRTSSRTDFAVRPCCELRCS
eukprot:3649930-Pleurochrysis_carterae.AAC.1